VIAPQPYALMAAAELAELSEPLVGSVVVQI
jgi:hypothetical protein